jgi:hypothetical protein
LLFSADGTNLFPRHTGATPKHAVGDATRKSQQKPNVFVVDDDISVRESLELLIKFAGLQPETFASAKGSHPREIHGIRLKAKQRKTS